MVVQEHAKRATLGNTRNLIPAAHRAGFEAQPKRTVLVQRLAEVEAQDGRQFDGVSFSSMDQLKRAQARWVKQRRYAMQAAAMRCVPSSHRLHACNRTALGGEVGIVQSPEEGQAHLRNVATCGSVWACPVCAAKVSERRRDELGKGLKRWREDFGGAVWLVTLTFSHSKFDRLAELMQKLSKAMRLFQGGKAAQRDHKQFGWWGQVRSLEVTHGKNGWHPHVHMLVFLETPDTHAGRERLRLALFDRWERACAKAGLGAPSEKHGVRVDGYERAGAYVTKWGLEHEMTKQVTKEGRGTDSRTPMAILADYLDTGDCEDAALFTEFAAMFKGQRQLVWSRNLKALLKVEDVSDEELAARDVRQAGDIDLISIPLPVWRLVVKHEVRGQLLALAGSGDVEAVKRFLRAMPGAEGMEVSHADNQGRVPRSLLEVRALNFPAD